VRLFALRDSDSRCGALYQLVALQDQDLRKRIRQRARRRETGNPGADYDGSLANDLGQANFPIPRAIYYTLDTLIVKPNDDAAIETVSARRTIVLELGARRLVLQGGGTALEHVTEEFGFFCRQCGQHLALYRIGRSRAGGDCLLPGLR
jgi:hypothetical protein